MNNSIVKSLVLSAVTATSIAFAAKGGNALWGWNISAGGNAGFGIKTNLRTSPQNAMANLPALHPVVGPTREEAAAAVKNALAAGQRVAFTDDKSAFIDPETEWAGSGTKTQNWRLPDSAADHANQKFHFNTEGSYGGYGHQYVRDDDGNWGRVGEWSEIVGGADTVRSYDLVDSCDDIAWGASIDLSHVLYVSESGDWGVDISFGLAWMISPDCHRGGGIGAQRSADVVSGTTDMSIEGGSYLTYADPEDGGWGSGTPDGSSGYTTWALDTAKVNGSPLVGGIASYADTMTIDSHGDYQEWEISAVLKPWYDINDWLCIHGALGVGVTRSSFDYTMEAFCNGSPIYRSSQEFAEWDVYGIAGAGLLLRLGQFDVSCDGLFRWCQDDMNINGRDVKGTIEKPWAVVRLGLSYDF